MAIAEMINPKRYGPVLENPINIINPFQVVEMPVYVGYTDEFPHVGEEHRLFYFSFSDTDGKLSTTEVKTSKVIDVLCLDGDGLVITTANAYYIVMLVHPFFKRFPRAQVYLGIAFYGSPMLNFGFYLRKFDFTNDGETVGLTLIQTYPVKKVKFLTKDICLAYTERDEEDEGYDVYVILLRESPLLKGSSNL